MCCGGLLRCCLSWPAAISRSSRCSTSKRVVGAANNRPLLLMAFKHKQNTAPLHVYVCTPAYNGQVDSDYAQSLAQTAFCCPMYNVQITAGIIGNVGFIELARNIFVKKFLENEETKDCTHLFFIDGDIEFEPRAFVGLVRSGLPICAGI